MTLLHKEIPRGLPFPHRALLMARNTTAKYKVLRELDVSEMINQATSLRNIY